MDFLSLLYSCSLYINDDLTVAIIDAVSNRNPYYIATIDDTYISYSFSNYEEAETMLQTLLKSKNKVAIGYFGLTIKNAKDYEVEFKKLLNPCTNIDIGSRLLDKAEYECKGSSRSERCIIDKYTSYTADYQNEFTDIVLSLYYDNQSNSINDSKNSEKVSSSIYPDGTNKVSEKNEKEWGNSELFFE